MHTAGVAEGSSSVADKSAALEEHTEAAKAEHSTQVTAEASDIVEEPSFKVGADIDIIELGPPSCQYPDDYLW